VAVDAGAEVGWGERRRVNDHATPPAATTMAIR